MKKVIAIIRTSTDRQEVESQKWEVVSLVLSDGYTEDEIEIVGGAGASAIKLDEAYLKNINKVYELIDKGGIKSVYAWGIDRIGRNEEILMQFKNRLIRNGIQLVIKNPSLRLLNEDGTVNSGVEIAFSLFATMAKQEMETKKARFHRGKKRNAENGKFNGGTVPYGYALDENNFYIVHPEQGEVVKNIFTLMSTNNYSTTTLTNELRERGIRVNDKLITYQFVVSLLKNTTYIGIRNRYGFDKVYPRIISDELFNKVREILSSNNSSKSKTKKNVYFGSVLIKCPECGRHYITHHGKYMCSSYNSPGMRRNMGQTECSNNIMVKVDHLDGLLWYVATNVHANYITKIDESEKEEIRNKIEVLSIKRVEIERTIGELSGKLSRIREIYIETGDRNMYNRNKKKIDDERLSLENSLTSNIEDEKRLNSFLEDTTDKLERWLNDCFNDDGSLNEEIMNQMVHRYVISVRIERNGAFDGVYTVDGFDMTNRQSLKVIVETVEGKREVFYYILHYKRETCKMFRFVFGGRLKQVPYVPIIHKK